MRSTKDEPELLEIRNVREEAAAEGVSRVSLETNAGTIRAILHRVPGEDRAVLWVGGAGGGVDGPAGRLYARQAADLVTCGISSLRLDYRFPNRLLECTADALAGLEYLRGLGITRVVLVGHSFGGAVVIEAAVRSELAAGVITLSTQGLGTDRAAQVSPRPLLILHGMNDKVLPDSVSRDLYRRAADPKGIRLYPGCGHGLDECAEAVERDVSEWIKMVLK